MLMGDHESKPLVRQRAVFTSIPITVLLLEERGRGLWIGNIGTGQEVARQVRGRAGDQAGCDSSRAVSTESGT
jgi:hypothetical protein